MPAELPQAEPAARAQQWSDAVRGSMAASAEVAPAASPTAQQSPAPTTTAGLDLATPVLVGPMLPPTGRVAEAIGAEGLDQPPTGLTGATPPVDTLPPVDAAMAGQAAGSAETRAPLAPSAGVPLRLLPMLEAAGYLPAAVTAPPQANASATTAATPGLAAPASLPCIAPAGLPGGGYAPVITLTSDRQNSRVAVPAVSHRTGTAGDPDTELVAYGESRPVPIDLAPVTPAVPAWRVDDTEALAPIGAGGTGAASARARQLYHALMDHGAGLTAIRPGEGLVTWEGSPLWLSLAGIGKPAAFGVLAAAAPGRVQIMHTTRGEWLVEHAGGQRPAPRAIGHATTAADEEAVLLDLLFGSAGLETAAGHNFQAAITAMRFAGRAPHPEGWRAQEAWAMVARLCAAVALQPTAAASAEAWALQRALAAVVDRRQLLAAADCSGLPLLSRERCVLIALVGDPNHLAAALAGLGRATLEQACQGRVEGIGPLESIALAMCLGRLQRVNVDNGWSSA